MLYWGNQEVMSQLHLYSKTSLSCLVWILPFFLVFLVGIDWYYSSPVGQRCRGEREGLYLRKVRSVRCRYLKKPCFWSLPNHTSAGRSTEQYLGEKILIWEVDSTRGGCPSKNSAPNHLFCIGVLKNQAERSLRQYSSYVRRKWTCLFSWTGHAYKVQPKFSD